MFVQAVDHWRKFQNKNRRRDAAKSGIPSLISTVDHIFFEDIEDKSFRVFWSSAES